jgi:AAHS family 4-hydroxybenzoate transporter-like MFS transporter
MSTPLPASAVDLARALDEGHWSPFQKLLLLFAALAFAVDGLANQVLGLAIPALIQDWSEPREAFAPVAAMGLVGVTFGTVLGGMFGDRFGRKIGLTGSVLFFGAMTLASAFANDVETLAVLRLFDGLGIGGAIPNGAALISEFTPARRRSLAISLGMVFIPVGGLLSGVIGSFALPTVGWRGLFLIAGVLPIALGVVFVFALPESPRFLARKPERGAELLKLLGRCGLRFAPQCVFIEDQTHHGRTRLSLLFDAQTLPSTLALWSAFFFCLLASYTMFSWIPTMLSSEGFSLAATSTGITAFHLGGVVGGVIGGWLIGRYGSRFAVVGLAAGCVVGALVLGLMPFDPALGLTWVALALVIEGFFIAGLHAGVYTLAAFIYPPLVRATGVGAASAAGRIGAVLSSFTGVITLRMGGSSSYFIVIAGTAAIAMISIALIRQHIPGSPPSRSGPSPTPQRAPA